MFLDINQLKTKDIHRLFLFAISELIYHQDFYLNILHDLSHWHKINITSKTKVQNRDKKKSFQILFRSCQLNISLWKYRVHIYSCLRHLIQTISMVRPCKLDVVYCSLMNLYTRCNWSTSLVLEMSLTTMYRKLSWYRQIPYYNLAGTICLCKWTIACISHILLKKSIINSIVLH